MESKRGQLLVAGPGLQDPNFRRTVVLICEHTEDGALGLVINRSTTIAVTDAVPELGELLGEGSRLWSGGPVQPQSIVLLAELDDPPEDALMVVGDVALVLQGADLEELAADARRGRAFLGYAGWGPEQLEGELERGDWIVLTAEPDDAFGEEGDALWGEVLARQGGEYALLATMPPDHSRASSPSRPASSGTASETSIAVERLMISPSAPSSVCSQMSTTVRWKFGSCRAGPATRSCPRLDSMENKSYPSGYCLRAIAFASSSLVISERPLMSSSLARA